MKIYLVMNHWDFGISGDGTKCLGAFADLEEAKRELVDAHYVFDEKNKEYRESSGVGDGKLTAWFADRNGDWHEWYIDSTELKGERK